MKLFSTLLAAGFVTSFASVALAEPRDSRAERTNIVREVRERPARERIVREAVQRETVTRDRAVRDGKQPVWDVCLKTPDGCVGR